MATAKYAQRLAKSLILFIIKADLIRLLTMARLKQYIFNIFAQFPESGRKAEEYGKSIRKLAIRFFTVSMNLKERFITLIYLEKTCLEAIDCLN